MKICIRFFAAFREITGVETEVVETTAATPAGLFEECTRRYAGLQNYSSSMVAINDEMVQWDSMLSEGDEVLFFPPVAGG